MGEGFKGGLYLFIYLFLFLVRLLVKCIGAPTIRKHGCTYSKEASMHAKKISEPTLKEHRCTYTKIRTDALIPVMSIGAPSPNKSIGVPMENKSNENKK